MDEEIIYDISLELAAFSKAVRETFEDDFEHLEEASIGYLMTNKELKIRGRLCAAFVTIPNAQGQDRWIYQWALTHRFGFMPDILMVANTEVWEEYSEEARVALVHHELCHIHQKESSRGPVFSKDDGRPELILVDHDLGEFFSVIGKYGEWQAGVRIFKARLKDKSERVDALAIAARAREILAGGGENG